ncbi:MAG TPA: DUF4235 domain-containing protein [Egibacteraceae bacterium]|nr:DUF4235 domain-containing protein [Egibacteraceae bacterium]
MDQVASGQAVGGRRPSPVAQAAGERNGLSDRVAAVEAARLQLGRDLDRLTVETRAQMGQTMEKIAWKVAGLGSAVLAGIAMRSALKTGWEKVRHEQPPMNPATPGTSWGEAVAWTMALGAGVGVARMLASRAAAAGWQKATGTMPPGLESRRKT